MENKVLNFDQMSQVEGGDDSCQYFLGRQWLNNDSFMSVARHLKAAGATSLMFVTSSNSFGLCRKIISVTYANG